MKIRKVLFAAVVVFIFAACDGYTDLSARTFDSSLWGTWETNTPPEYLEGYKGGIVITRDTITITGYEGYIGYAADEATRPFRGVTRGGALPCYSEKTASHDYPDYEGTLFIKDAGVWQTGVAYSFYRTGSGSSSYRYFVRFAFGGRAETLRKTGEAGTGRRATFHVQKTSLSSASNYAPKTTEILSATTLKVTGDAYYSDDGWTQAGVRPTKP
jgi:hypothetical protein